MKKILAVAAAIALLCSCSQHPDEAFLPLLRFSLFDEGHAQVDILAPTDDLPRFVDIGGRRIPLVVVNSAVVENGGDVLMVPDGILAVNSRAYEGAVDVRTVVLPDSMQSLGVEALPPNTVAVHSPSLACEDLQKALVDPKKLEYVHITDTGIADLRGLEGLKAVESDGVWPMFPSLPDKDGTPFQGWYADGRRAVPYTTASGKAEPVWGWEGERASEIVLSGIRLSYKVHSSPEYRMEMSSTENGRRFSTSSFPKLETRWFADGESVGTGGFSFEGSFEPGVHTVRCMFYSLGTAVGMSQITFTETIL